MIVTTSDVPFQHGKTIMKRVVAISIIGALALTKSAECFADGILVLGQPEQRLQMTTEEPKTMTSGPVLSGSLTGQATIVVSARATPTSMLTAKPSNADATVTESSKKAPIQHANSQLIPSVDAPNIGAQIASALEKKRAIRFYNINFDFDQSTLRRDSFKPISDIADALKIQLDLRIVIEGHTDSRGDSDYNTRLSQRRADAVAEALVAIHGIGRARLTPIGVGEASPVSSNQTDAGRAANRRVEIRKQ